MQQLPKNRPMPGICASISACRPGSITVIVIGLLWLMGIVTGVIYTITMQMEQVLILREVQLRAWHALRGGMLTGLAHLNDQADTGAQNISQPELLYEGVWRVDPRHEQFFLILRLQHTDSDHAILTGELYEHAQLCAHLEWYLDYDRQAKKWHVVKGKL